MLEKAALNATNQKSNSKDKNDDIMSVLLAHEKQNTGLIIVLIFLTYFFKIYIFFS